MNDDPLPDHPLPWDVSRYLRPGPDLSTLAFHQGEPLLRDESRDARVPFRGRIHLLVPHEPWRIRLPLTGLDVGLRGVSALMPESSQAMVAAFEMLAEGKSYELQLESPLLDPEGLPPPPPVRASLNRRVKTASGLELNFTFETMDALLIAFIEEHMASKVSGR